MEESANSASASGVCVFCQRNDLSSAIVGEVYTKDSVTVHHNCLYFSSGLAQNGSSESEGICGFLVSDILAEVRRASSRKMHCSVCRRPGKFVGCSVPSCTKGGHYPCLRENGYLFQHFDKFHAFCPRHAPSQPALSHSPENCCICLSSFTRQGLYCPCCKTMFHRNCVQMQASTAGRYFFRCPTCNNDGEYIKEMLKMGVAIPERDAKWEIENYFGAEYADPKFCQVHSCLCPLGREHYSRKYRMIKCQTCGRWMGHALCLNGRPKECCLCASVAEKLLAAAPTVHSPRSQPDTSTFESHPNTSTLGSRSDTTTLKSRPNTSTFESRPNTSTLGSRSDTTTLKSRPNTSTFESRPNTSTLGSRSDTTTLKSRPNTSTLESRPNTSTLGSRSDTTTLKSRPNTSTLESRPNTSTLGSRSDTTTLKSQPNISTLRSQPDTYKLRSRAKTATSKSQPQTSMSRSPPCTSTSSSYLRTCRTGSHVSSGGRVSTLRPLLCRVAKKERQMMSPIYKLLNPQVIVHRLTLQELAAATRIKISSDTTEEPVNCSDTRVSSTEESFECSNTDVSASYESSSSCNARDFATSSVQRVITSPDHLTVATKISEPSVTVNSPTLSYAGMGSTVTSWSGQNGKRQTFEWIVRQDVDNEFKFWFSRVYS